MRNVKVEQLLQKNICKVFIMQPDKSQQMKYAITVMHITLFCLYSGEIHRKNTFEFLKKKTVCVHCKHSLSLQTIQDKDEEYAILYNV